MSLMYPPIRETYDLGHKRLTYPTNTIKFRKSHLKRTIPKPYILPKLHTSTIHLCHQFCAQSPHSLPYFASMTLIQRASLSVPYLHNHLPSKALLNLLKYLIPNLPFSIGLQTLNLFSQGSFGSSPIPLQRKSLYNFSIGFTTFIGTGRREEISRQARKSTLIRVTLPPLDKYNLFQQTNVCSIFSRIGFQII